MSKKFVKSLQHLFFPNKHFPLHEKWTSCKNLMKNLTLNPHEPEHLPPMTLDIESFPSKKSKQVFKIFKKILQERSIKCIFALNLSSEKKKRKKKRIYLDILTTVFLGMSEVVLINVGWQWPLGLLADPSVRRFECRWFLPPGTRGTLTERTTGRAEPCRAHGFAQMMTGRGAGRWMRVVIGVRGWPPVDYVDVPSWRRCLGRSLTPRPFLLLAWFWVRWAHIRRGVPHRALLQRQHRPLTHPAWWVHLRVPRVVAASRRPGAKRIPGRRVVHDGLHIASRTFPGLSSSSDHQPLCSPPFATIHTRDYIIFNAQYSHARLTMSCISSCMGDSLAWRARIGPRSRWKIGFHSETRYGWLCLVP